MSCYGKFHDCQTCQKWHFAKAPHLPERAIEDSEWVECFWMFGFPYAHPKSTPESLKLFEDEFMKTQDSPLSIRKWRYCEDHLPRSTGFLEWETIFGHIWTGYYCVDTGYWLGKIGDLLTYHEYMCETRVVVRWRDFIPDKKGVKWSEAKNGTA